MQSELPAEISELFLNILILKTAFLSLKMETSQTES